jgi:hypothetical protein
MAKDGLTISHVEKGLDIHKDNYANALFGCKLAGEQLAPDLKSIVQAIKLEFILREEWELDLIMNIKMEELLGVPLRDKPKDPSLAVKVTLKCKGCKPKEQAVFNAEYVCAAVLQGIYDAFFVRYRQVSARENLILDIANRFGGVQTKAFNSALDSTAENDRPVIIVDEEKSPEYDFPKK